MKNAEARRCEVLLAMQQALLGEVTAHLRAICVSYCDHSIHFEAYFDGIITDDDRDRMSLVEAEVMALFPSTHVIKFMQPSVSMHQP